MCWRPTTSGNLRDASLKTVHIPKHVLTAVIDLRTHLTTAVEPPVFVSDRRLRRGVQLLQVAAYLDGRDALQETDLLLLQHVLWHQPQEREQVVSWVMGRLAHDQDGGQRETHRLQGAGGCCRAAAMIENPECGLFVWLDT